MNPAEDRFVEVGHSVRGQKHDTLTIFDFAKEHRDKLVARDIVLRALFQIHIRFIQKNQCIPVVGSLEDA